MTLTIGILQGRLSPSQDGRFQFFPPKWEEEFSVAARLGFSAIEWLVDWPDWETNPILDPKMTEKIFDVTERTGIPVNSLCGDYFMKYRLAGKEAKTSETVAIELVQAAARVTKQKLLLLPLLEQNTYSTEDERTEVVTNLSPAVREAERLGVRIGFETEMPISELVHFLDRFDSSAVGVYYDIGNCTSYGFNCSQDLLSLGNRVFGVHIKDRKVGSPQSLSLGMGDANIHDCLRVLTEIEFHGVPIMQAWRGENYLQDAIDQLNFIKN